MATKNTGKGHRKSQTVNGERRVKNQAQGKTLLERLGMAKKVEKGNRNNNSGSIKDVGLRVVNGRLVSANDVGVLLREAAARTEPAHKNAKRAQQNGKSVRLVNARTVKQRTSATGTVTRVESSVQRREMARSRDRAAVQPYGKDLYLTVNTAAQMRFLRLRNLPLGSDSQSLAEAVEKIAGVAVQKTSIIDLPSGSVTAELWLQSSDARVLSEAQKRLDRANVNNRVISAEICST
ncbi:LAME_0H06018g1_1 [Lachancea meyersii CBS 8951]|uniref:LAME_0H06018g1_1 n=1 Tax=Lachancea meyersii CBS 8951 TaxID=1266667 RepID=A0A1G4KEK6_9SACH|nr:LAME_0H06018g1_1 [Lachancea meyersii CBS 8951]